MDMGIDASRRYDHPLACQRFCGRSHGHSRSDPIHDGRISGFADPFDFSGFDSDIRLHDSGIVHDQGIGDDQIQIPVAAAGLHGLAHAVPDGFPAPEFDFIAVGGIILFHFDDKICIRQPDFISRRRAKHHRIFFTGKFYAHFCLLLLFYKSSLFCLIKRFLFRRL